MNCGSFGLPAVFGMARVHYFDAVPAVIQATRTIVHRAARPETPARLRLWVVVAIGTAAALFATMSVVMARVQDQVRIIGDVAAPQAATAADLYFALSDMDAQVARMVLTGDSDTLAGSQIDALGTYRQRSRQVDTDIQRSLTTATSDTDRAIVLELLNHLAVYRQRVWQALTAGAAAPGYYTQATNVLHIDLLPTAKRWRDASEARLDDAYAAKRVTETAGMTLAILLGTALVLVLAGLQIWLARRFRRILNPALIVATALSFALVVPAVTILGVQEKRLGAARDDSLTPFLALSQARAISYDAAADTSRFLISDNLAYYAQNFTAKADCLTGGGSCGSGGETIAGGLASVAGGPDVSPAQSAEVVSRWAGYRKDHERITGLAAAGKEAEAIDALTGIRRGDAAFDFSYYDAAVAEIATARKAAFDTSLREIRTLLTGWPVIPVVAMAVVILLILLSVRRRFAEYR
jgi:hypothetical protein